MKTQKLLSSITLESKKQTKQEFINKIENLESILEEKEHEI